MVSGQRVNFRKSEIVFSGNVGAEIKRNIKSLLQVDEVCSHSKYLGLPLTIGQKRCEAFKEIIEKSWKRTMDWKHNLLSIAGREILIKSVLQALPLYMMAVFLFPQKVLDKLSAIILNFWWNKEGTRGIHWLSKRVLLEPKDNGGIGFKNLRYFNEALIMRLCWRILKFPDLLVSKVIKGRYFPRGDLFNATCGYRPSIVWQSILKVRSVFLRGLTRLDEEPYFIWNQSSNGEFATSTAYTLAKGHYEEGMGERTEQSDKSQWRKFWKTLWAVNVPNKVKIFNWRFFYNALPDASNLLKRGVDCDSHCKLCGEAVETSWHLINSCWWGKSLWSHLGLDSLLDRIGGGDGADLLWWVGLFESHNAFAAVLIGSWLIWRNRNEVWHGKAAWDPHRAALWGQNLLQSLESCKGPEKSNLNWLASCWRSPKEGEVRVSIDGSWDRRLRRMGLGILWRDSQGCVLWSIAVGLDGGWCSSVAEGRALEMATKLTEEKRLESVIFETDSLEVVEAIVLQGSSGSWLLEWFPDTMRRFLNHDGWRITHVPRDSNAAADSLARKACSEDWNWTSFSAIPRCIADFV